VGIIEDFERERDSNSDLVKFKCLVGDEKYEDIVSYNEMVELIEEQVRNEDGTWRFRQIKGHTKPRRRSDKPKILIEWESGEVTLEPVYNIAIKELKGTDPLNFLLGCDYFYEDGILCQAPKQYIEKMVESYVRFFGEKPSRRVTSPLEKGDHPELDTSEFLGVDETRIYQSMIGSAQWVISIGRFDIAVHIMTLSSFRAQPRRGHLDRIKRVYAYLAKMKHAVIRYRTDMPDVSDFVFPELDWSNTPYSGSVEELPTNLPPARGKPVLMTTFADANLGHDFISGKSVTGLLHFLNKTPFDWFSKKQGTVETATFGSENSAARSAIEQIRANKLTLLFMGVPLSGCPILLGDNKSVVDSGTIPHQQLHKRHLMLSYHFVREAIASGELRFAHINGEFNPSDVLSKHWGYQVVWPLLRPILFWKGDTMDIVKETKGKTVES
jgi:hypothetical protein